MFELKTLHKDAIAAAVEKAERYRFLHEPSAAESICRDILQIDPGNQKVLVMLILSLADQFGAVGRMPIERVRELIPKLTSEYQRYYYSGIICERWAKAQLNQGSIGSGSHAYEWLHEAMTFYEQAEALHSDGNDEAILRWNSCVRTIQKHKLEPPHDDGMPPQLE